FLADFPADDFALVMDALAFVWFRFLQRADLRSGTADKLLVDARNFDHVLLNDDHDAFHHRHANRQCIAQVQNEFFAFEGNAIANPFEFQNFRETDAHAFRRILDKGPHRTKERGDVLDTRRFCIRLDPDLFSFDGDFNAEWYRDLQLAFRTLDRNKTIAHGY